MIEQIQAAGQSGTTDKSTKHGKNGLFAKLLAMLEKNAELSNKGKGLQLNAGKLSKGKGLAGLTEKSDPFTVAKGKHLLALAAKGKAEGKDKADDATVSLLAAHVIVDPKSYAKTADKTATTSVLIAGQLGGKAETQAGDVFGKAGIEAGLEKGLLNKGTDKVDLFQNQMTAADKKAEVGLAGKTAEAGLLGKAAEAGLLGKEASAQKGALNQTAAGTVAESAALASDDGVDAVLAAEQKKLLASAQGAKADQLLKSVQAESAAGNAQAINNKTDLDGVARTALEASKGLGSAQANHSLGGKKAVKAAVENINTAAAAAALFQQVKAAQPQQIQQPATATSMGAAQATLAEAFQSGAGSQFSDHKDGQDSRSLNATMLDVKSTASSASTQSNFQNYLSSKTAPVFSPFDSMNYIAQSAKNGQTRLEIQLDPANLGKIQISLQSDASKHLQVQIIADQGMTRAALEQQLPQLRSALAQQGFDLSGFSMDSRGQQASTGGDGDGRKSQSFSKDAEALSSDALMSAPEQQQKATGSGLSIRV
ncbi:MAG: flagellar hook-length control protein FliK [Mariprofundus sp.]|nr:flagellar hook-length control protein FliK [Mariprofundus sp.]